MANLYYNFDYISLTNEVLITSSDNSFRVNVTSSAEIILHNGVISIPISMTSSIELNYYNFGTINGLSISSLNLTDISSIGTYLNYNCFIGANSGVNVIGKVSIDQTSPGVTNFVTNNQTQKLGIGITVGSGLVTPNTERIVLANRVETLNGSIAMTSDIATISGHRIKTLLFTNNSNAVVYLQIFNKSIPLADGDIPLNGLIFRVPANSTLDKTVADFGEAGVLYCTDMRIGLSSTFNTFTAISPTNTSISIITVL